MNAIASLRRTAIPRSLFPPTDLASAITRLSFIQADPIRSPARAQDLIMRHRAQGYRAGDLERLYPTLEVEEDRFYVYGFMARPLWRLLHPRDMTDLTPFEQQVLETVSRYGPIHPKDLETHHGSERTIGPWGSYARATKVALDSLHRRGLLRIARRDNGIRVYEPAPPINQPLSPPERLQQLTLVIASILAPAHRQTLQETVNRLRWRECVPILGDTTKVISQLLKTGELEEQIVEGISYIAPAGVIATDEPPRTVQFLAPFDPVVWDRRRFEHLWGWGYRFEAYTPAAKRLRGYYAMPLLWGDAIIGWANISNNGQFIVETGFVGEAPRDPAFASALENEVERIRKFLNLIPQS